LSLEAFSSYEPVCDPEPMAKVRLKLCNTSIDFSADTPTPITPIATPGVDREEYVSGILKTDASNVGKIYKFRGEECVQVVSFGEASCTDAVTELNIQGETFDSCLACSFSEPVFDMISCGANESYSRDQFGVKVLGGTKGSVINFDGQCFKLVINEELGGSQANFELTADRYSTVEGGCSSAICQATPTPTPTPITVTPTVTKTITITPTITPTITVTVTVTATTCKECVVGELQNQEGDGYGDEAKPCPDDINKTLKWGIPSLKKHAWDGGNHPIIWGEEENAKNGQPIENIQFTPNAQSDGWITYTPTPTSTLAGIKRSFSSLGVTPTPTATSISRIDNSLPLDTAQISFDDNQREFRTKIKVFEYSNNIKVAPNTSTPTPSTSIPALGDIKYYEGNYFNASATFDIAYSNPSAATKEEFIVGLFNYLKTVTTTTSSGVTVYFTDYFYLGFNDNEIINVSDPDITPTAFTITVTENASTHGWITYTPTPTRTRTIVPTLTPTPTAT